MRQAIGEQVRLKDPSSALRTSHVFGKGPVRGDPDAFFGKANRPSTPIKDVVNESYARDA